MEKKVYLWELDSVRKSNKECQTARETLFRELFAEGHVVVMTFNQLADARWMIPIFENKDNYDSLMQLFKVGAIRVSHYGNIRTASQYTQNALKKALDKKADFIFSGMPIQKRERYLLQEILNAVQFSDPERLWADIESLQSLCKGSLDLSIGSKLLTSIIEEKERLEAEPLKGEPASFDIQVCTYYYMLGIENDSALLKACLKYETERLLLIYRYVKLILLVSQEKTTDNDAVKKSTPYMEIMQAIFQIDRENLEKYDVRWEDLFVRAVEDLSSMKVALKDANSRSFWHNLIDKKRETDYPSQKRMRDFQKLLADVCYNFTLESSIDGVYCAYDDSDNEIFVREFVCRMSDYYDLYRNKIHCVNQINNAEPVERDNLRWKQVAEVRKDVQEYEKHAGRTDKKRMKWSLKVRKTQVVHPIERFLWCMLLFIAMKITVEGLEAVWDNRSKIMKGLEVVWNNHWIDWLKDDVILPSGGWLLNQLGIFAILGAFIFAVIASRLQIRLGIPDILDICGNLGHKWSNWKEYRKIRRTDACATNKRENG